MRTRLTLDQDIQAIVDAVHAPGAQEYCDMTVAYRHRHYLAYEDHTDPRWAPLLTPSLADLPPATIILAACDPLRDEGIAYARRLAQEGNDVTLKVYSGVTHPFFSWSGALPKARDAVAFAASQLAASVA